MLYRMVKKIFRKNIVEGKKSRMRAEETQNIENNKEIFLKTWISRIGSSRNLEYFGTKQTDKRKLFTGFCRANHGLSTCVVFFFL